MKKWIALAMALVLALSLAACGSTDDVQRRLEAHRAGKGAKYTRGRGPLELVYTEECEGCSAALRREHAIKKLSRMQKLQLAGSDDT